VQNNTLLTNANTRSGIIVFMQKVASTVADAVNPKISTQGMESSQFWSGDWDVSAAERDAEQFLQNGRGRQRAREELL
jgi:hypothetical protein